MKFILIYFKNKIFITAILKFFNSSNFKNMVTKPGIQQFMLKKMILEKLWKITWNSEQKLIKNLEF